LLLLGNDVVDLTTAGIAGKTQNARFVKRIFSNKEQNAISESENPDQTLWMTWAAKETAYKLISKIIGPPVFSHIRFETTFLQPSPDSKFNVEVVYNKWKFPLKINLKKNYIHAVGVYKEIDNQVEYLFHEKILRIKQSELKYWDNKFRWADIFTKEELPSIRQVESALVRLHCKKSIAENLNISPTRLQIIRPTKELKSHPPFILLDDKRTEIDISLSHHGSWLGWCFSQKL